ncbi:hypothetical protein B0I32_1301, partial [Nonomuraea fuscirosea]
IVSVLTPRLISIVRRARARRQAAPARSPA